MSVGAVKLKIGLLEGGTKVGHQAGQKPGSSRRSSVQGGERPRRVEANVRPSAVMRIVD